MTKQIIEKMPKHIICTIEGLRKDLKNPSISNDATRKELAGYVKGLRDAGLISERERQVLFIYGTV